MRRGPQRARHPAVGALPGKPRQSLVRCWLPRCGETTRAPEQPPCTCTFCVSTPGRVGFTSIAIFLTEGSKSRRIPSRFATSSALSKVAPVMFPPGRLKLATRPIATGSAALMKTIGIVVVADFAANAEAGLPPAAITDTLRRNQVVGQYRLLDQSDFLPSDTRWRRFDPQRSQLPSRFDGIPSPGTYRNPVTRY